MPRSRQTHQPTPHALHPRQLRYSLPNWTPRPAFSTLCRLPAGTDHAAQPPRAHEPRAARRPAGRRSPTKPMLPTASTDANPPGNALRLGPGSLPAAPRPTARRTPTPRPPSPASRSKKRPPRIRHPTQIATTDSVDLRHSNAAVSTGYYATGVMDGGPGGSATPVRASPAAVQQQKLKPVSGAFDPRAAAGRAP